MKARAAALGGAAIAGAALRLYQIRDQHLIADEWHSLHAAATESLTSLLSLVTMGATSIPMNVYTKLLLDTVGWNELAIRLPSLVAGIAALFVLPLLVRDLFRPRTTVLFAYLIAISPLLVFYSRCARPYGIVVLLTFVSLVACYRWAASGRLAHGLLFVGSGIIAAYFHLTEIRIIFLPLLLLVALKVCGTGIQRRIRPSLTALIAAGLVTALLLALFFAPGFVFRGQQLTSVVRQSPPDWATLLGMTELMAGNSVPVVRALWVGLAVVGFVVWFRRDWLFAGLALTTIFGSFAMVFLLQPLTGDRPAVFVRYVIAILPLALLAVASGADEVLRYAAHSNPLSHRRADLLLSAALAAGVVALVGTGPLPATYAGRNDFTNRREFQGTYSLSARSRYDSLVPLRPAFYDRVRAEDGCDAVVEYPSIVAEPNSPYFLYQGYHQKRVIGGYFHTPSPGSSGEQHGVVGGNWQVDDVLMEVSDSTKLRFRNLVDLGNRAAVRATGACYLIVHPHPERELRGPDAPAGPAPARVPDFARFGPPIHVDALTTVFDLRRSP